MAKINVKIYDQGGVDCTVEHCVFKFECANHKTAGDYRNEDGFTPDITEEDGQFLCATKDAPMDDDETYQGRFPEDYDKMGRGALTIDQIEAKTALNYQI